MALINIFKNNPTVGLTDGASISAAGDFSAPIQFSLDAASNESAVQKLAIRTNSGYRVNGNTTITDINDSNDRIKLSLTENGTWSDTLTIGGVSDVNTVFYIKASSASTELPTLDRSASLKVTAIIEAV